jgi:hypothetical protein
LIRVCRRSGLSENHVADFPISRKIANRKGCAFLFTFGIIHVYPGAKFLAKFLFQNNYYFPVS